MRVLVVVLLALAACAPGERITSWTLARDDGEVAVTLPSNLVFDLPAREHDYRLRATVPIKPEWRGRELTFVIPCFHGRIALAVDGIAIAAFSTAGEHRFLLSSDRTAKPALELAITAHLDNLSSVGFGVAPYLTDVRETRSTAAAINHDSAIMELALILVFGVLYIAMYALARRPQDLAFVVIAAFSAVAPAWQLGYLDSFGPFRAAFPGIAVCGAQIGILYFIHRTFGLGREPRWLVNGFTALAIAHLVGSQVRFEAVPVFTWVLALFSAAYILYLLRALASVARTNPARRGNAILMTVGMILTGMVVVPDFFGLIFGRNLLGGVHTISLGIVGCVFTQVLLLSRSHVARQRELERNAEELRRQVVERSRELSVALAELAKRPPEPLGVDRVIADRYRIVRRLGAGGMGTVYEVARIFDNTRLALKTLRGRTDPEIMQRFAREAEIAAKLDHPNLVPVLDVGIADGALYLVMPLVEGGSLERQRPRFGDAAWARPILGQIATGLAALHAGGIVHRDLKPGNVLLAPDARIADFGLAGLDPSSLTLASGPLDSLAHAETAMPASPPLTRAGDIFGTPRYMAPELAAGANEASPAVDIFAFGVMAYEMLTKQQPFAAPLVMSRLEDRRPDAPRMDAVPDEVREILTRCLTFDPSARPSAADLAAAFHPQ